MESFLQPLNSKGVLFLYIICPQLHNFLIIFPLLNGLLVICEGGGGVVLLSALLTSLSWTYSPHPTIEPTDPLLRHDPKRQKIFPNYFKHPTSVCLMLQSERHFSILTAFFVLLSEGSWLMRKVCKPHWNSIEVQSCSDASSIPMNSRDVEFHVMVSAYTRSSIAV